ncbi:MAG: hypothetical protein N2738_08155 [Thermodesulfovibrionales bacterium]|nr:hypothetical protein [Thermodesulfovibrionales bacterium]
MHLYAADQLQHPSVKEKTQDLDDEHKMIYLHPDKNLSLNNTIDRFMGFIEIISPAPVVNYKSDKNTQLARITKCTKKKEVTIFSVRCDFEFTGTGYFVSLFNKERVIQNTIKSLGKKTAKKKLIKEMSVENGGLGFIEVEGIINKDMETVNKVTVNFSGRGVASPVKITLFEAQFDDGVYVKKDDEPLITATVKSLTFKRKIDTDKPKMDIKLESVGDAHTLVGVTRAFIANSFIIEPIKITETGNILMLDFGEALSKNKQYFSFK